MSKILVILFLLMLSGCDKYEDAVKNYVPCDFSERGPLTGTKEIGFIVSDNKHLTYCVTRTYFVVGDESYQSAYLVEIFNSTHEFQSLKLGIIYPELAELGLREQNLDGRLVGNKLIYNLNVPPTDNKAFLVFFRMEVKPTSMQKKDDTSTTYMPVIINY